MGKDTPLTDEQLADLERSLGLAEIQSVRSGVPYPLGATVRGAGVNFALFSRHAIGVRLDLFDRVDAGMPTRTIILEGDGARADTPGTSALRASPPAQSSERIQPPSTAID